MAPSWHARAKSLRKTGQSLSMIAAKLDVSPQAVSVALDPKKQAARRKYVKKWSAKQYENPEFRKLKLKQNRASKRRRREDPKRAPTLRAHERAESAERYKDPKYRKAHRKRMRET